MARLFWVGVGAAGAVLLARRVRTAVHRYTPDGVAEQVEHAGRGTVSALRESVDTFTTARATRERELLGSLLVTPEGGDAGAVFGRRDRAGRGEHLRPNPPAQDAGASGTSPASGAVPSGRVDEDEPLYDF